MCDDTIDNIMKGFASHTPCYGTYLIFLVIYCLMSVLGLKDWEIKDLGREKL